MIWTKIRTSPSNWGGLLGSLVPYRIYCFVRKGDFDCDQLPPHMNYLVNTYKEPIVRTPYGDNVFNRFQEHQVLFIEDENSKGSQDSITKLCTMGKQHMGFFLDF